MLPFYHNSESVEIACFLSRFPTFRIYGTGAYLGVDLTMFRAFPEEEVARAIELSGLSALVAERGALALCGENGSALSGGERQRVSIARSLLRRCDLILALKGGRIVERGSFDELMERRGYFYSLFTLAQQ